MVDFWDSSARGESSKIVTDFWKIRLGVKMPKLWRTPRTRQIQKIHAQHTTKKPTERH